jgi:ribonuclease Z
MDEIKYSYQNNGTTNIKTKVGSDTYNIRGYSRAGLKTSIMIDELNVVFDMGYADEKAFSYDNKLISHGHTDHIGSLHIDHCARQLYDIKKGKLIVMPYRCFDPFKMLSTAFSEMNCGKSGDIKKIFDKLHLTQLVSSESCLDKYQYLIGVSKPISNFVLKSFLMDHKIEAFGYIIYRVSRKLKSEYVGLQPHEIIQIKKTSKCITTDCYTSLVGYTGDTSIDGVLNNSELLNVRLLIMECTGFGPNDICQCNEGKHIHWEDIVKNSDKFKNDKILLFHFSQKYKVYEDIAEYIHECPKELANKLLFFF